MNRNKYIFCVVLVVGIIVIAILDSGVEYPHADLINNIWTRPTTIKPDQDRDLGTVDDVHGRRFQTTARRAFTWRRREKKS
jgi:hypothetical protein